MLVASRWVHPWPQHMNICVQAYISTHIHICAGAHLCARPHARVWKDMMRAHTHTDHLKLLLHLSWQCQSLSTVTQADKPVWCECWLHTSHLSLWKLEDYEGWSVFYCIWITKWSLCNYTVHVSQIICDLITMQHISAFYCLCLTVPWFSWIIKNH